MKRIFFLKINKYVHIKKGEKFKLNKSFIKITKV